MRHLIPIYALVLSILWGCTPRTGYVAITGPAQGGTYTIKINMKGVDKDPVKIKEGIDSIITLIDTTLSGYNKGSILTRFNEGEAVELNPMFLDIYDLSREIWKETDGAFDVAAGPLFDIWGFGFSEGEKPSAEEVESVRQSCGSALLPDGKALASLSSQGLQKGKLNFNAIAQGYSCDVVANYLYGLGVKDMLVDIGEIFCDGMNPSGKGWTIAVDKPIDGNQTLGEQREGIWMGDGRPCGVVTSGNYRKFYVVDGRKYAHTIDPRTGYPVEHSLLSATVIAPNGALADAYATYCMVIGLEESIQFIQGRSDLEAFLIYDEGGEMKNWKSGGFNLLEGSLP